MKAKILIATDGSKYSKKAVDHGIQVAIKQGYDVLALYVINMKSLELFALSHHDDITGYEGANEMLRAEGEEALAYAVEKGKEAGVNVSTSIVRGYPAQEIIKQAEKEDVGLIVVGNLGKTGLEHLLMGSVSEEVVKKAPCPVLVVRGDV
ncbi:universal stress protein [Methanocella sp. CWC-04]|uniref:Universal stress protein n=1 Tax=Methanooceanicella nereidis TaxID=2052831 RepID=A0AAP2RCP0_9EURY|nr:universal stress protein [Methanocella sp. CWC-04]MCD1294978.1 universal stress protein [Methanocella sp. CWC-04]